jgi:hypothetical protein
MDSEVIITSYPDYEELVAEIYYNNTLIAEINIEKGEPEIILFNIQDSIEIAIPYDTFINLISSAQNRLKSMCS